MARAGHPEAVLGVFDAAADAFTTLQQAENVAEIGALRGQTRGNAADSAASLPAAHHSEKACRTDLSSAVAVSLKRTQRNRGQK